MILSRSTALRAVTRTSWNTSVRSSRQPVLRQQYSTAKDTVKSSSSLPWALSAILATAGGTYFALQPRDSVSHSDHHASEHESHEDESESPSDSDESVVDKVSNLKEAASDKKEQVKEKLGEEKEAHKEKVAKITASLIKGERSGDSVKNHGIASEKNEHKIRQGKFCDDEFDNHITVHSGDPGKDFERIKKEKAEK